MKRISIIGLCLATAAAATAQKAVVKEAESAMKSGKPFVEVVNIITPAFTNPETEKQADIYFIPGKAGFKEYDDVLGKKQIGLIKADDPQVAAAANALMGGYEYFLKALPLDSLPNEKGKVKPKYSKEIINTIVGHQSDFNLAAIDFYNAKEYGKAYDSWDIFINFPNNPVLANAKIQQFPDSTMSDICYNQGIAAWQDNNFEKAIKAFRNAISKGYNKKSVFDYGMAVAQNGKDNDALLEFAEAGNKLYGSEDNTYLNMIVNYYLNTEKYDEAMVFLNKGIEENPDNAQYYALAGIIYDNQNQRDKAFEMYDKSVSLDPNNGLGNFYLGRAYAAKAGDLSDAYTGNDYDSYKVRELYPLYNKAKDYLEKAYEVDENNRSQILTVLDIVYYNLNDAAGQESVKERKMAD